MSLAFWSAGLLLLWVYWGYGALLRRWPGGVPAPRRPVRAGMEPPRVGVLVTVHDGAAGLAARLDNLLASDYPPHLLDILVVSDGSTDATAAIAAGYAKKAPVRLLVLERQGKSAAQNAAMRTMDSEIIVLTDVDALFAPDCLAALVAPFADPATGCVTAHLLMRDGPGAIAGAQNRYWRYELMLRGQESRLGLLAVASGPAMAFRRALFRPLPGHAGDDCILPLDVIAQGFRVVHAADALASDAMNHRGSAELRARIRMTARNWSGTWRYPALLAPWRHPGYAFALWSHKLLRWLGSLGLAAMMAAGGLALAEGRLLSPEALFLGGTAAAGLAGGLGARRGWRLPLLSALYSFLLANLGFALGLAVALSGRRIVAYRTAGLDAGGQSGQQQP